MERSRVPLQPAGLGGSPDQADGDGTGYIVHDEIGKRNIFKARAGAAAHLDWAAIDLLQKAIGDGDILRHAAAKAEHRPARAEGAVGNSHHLATAE